MIYNVDVDQLSVTDSVRAAFKMKIKVPKMEIWTISDAETESNKKL